MTVTVVTGGASGLGLALGERAAALDMDLVLLGLDNPGMAAMLASADGPAAGVIEAVLTDEPYIITHGDLVEAVAVRSANFLRAAEAARGA